jgi:glycosyltransferase involved in cell wall biosynthesis
MQSNVISYYELSKELCRSIELKRVGQVNYTILDRRSERGLLQMFRQFRRLKEQSIIVALEGEQSRQLAGPLILLAALTGSKQVDVLWPDQTWETVSSKETLSWALRVFKAQISTRWAYRKALLLLKQLQGGSGTVPKRSPVGTNLILYLDGNLPIGTAVGGSVAHTRGVIDGFIENGFQVHYASGKRIPTDHPNARWLEIPKSDLLAFPPELNCYEFNEMFDRSVKQFVANESYAFIYQRMSVHNFTGAMLRRKFGIPLVLEYNGSEAWAAANWNRKLRLHDVAVNAEMVSLAYADLVVTVSDALADEAAAIRVSREKIVVYPNCIDPKIFDPGRFEPEDSRQLRAQLGIKADARIAMFIGTFGAWHGVEFLAKAIRRLIDGDLSWVADHRLHFLLVGDGLKMAEVQATLAEKPYADFVTITGAVPQSSAPAYLAASDIFLCPHVPNADGSVFFGSPTKLFEYMAMERPIVASDLAQIGDVLKGILFGEASNSTGLMAELFEPGHEGGFLAALRNVVENPEAAAQMAKNARAAALGSFTWKQHVSAVLSRAKERGIL